MRIAVFISGTGTNLKSLIDASLNKEIKSSINLIISNKDAKGLFHGYNANIPSYVVKDDEEILEKLKENNIDFIVLAGYLKKVSEIILKEYENKIINIHPSLLPKYGGKNFYGLKVHEAVFKNGDKISGVTVHYVDENLDSGNVIMQKEVDISDCKSPIEIKNRILEEEHIVLKEAVRRIEEAKWEHLYLLQIRVI